METIKKEDTIKAIKIIFNIFLENSYEYYDDFIKEINITDQVFKRYLKIIKENDIYLYTKIAEKKEKLIERKSLEIQKDILNMVDLCKKGITTNNQTRPFDAIDFYESTKFTPQEISEELKKCLTYDDWKMFRIFLGEKGKKISSNDYHEEDTQRFLNTNLIIGVEYDKEGKIIPNTGTEITKKDRETIIKIIEDKNIPLKSSTVKAAYKRFVNDEITNNKTRKRK